MDRQSTLEAAAPETSGEVKVWDLPVRLFHWTLAASVAVACVAGFLLGASWLNLHLIAGSIIAVLILFRLIWGFTGSAYSRFSSFVFRPSEIIAHIRGGVGREAGHNPLGALMVFALLAVLAAIVVSGAILLGGAFKQGPFKSLITFATAWPAREIHELLAYGILALVAGHLGGVIFESRRSGENLAASMVTGRKRNGFAHALLRTQPKTLLALVATLLIGGGAVGGVYALSLKPPYGVPAFTANQAWAKECSACHIAFHPSLLPAASWSAMMDDLANHFGEDASLDAATTADIKTFLTANAAEGWDTLPANRLRNVNPDKPLEITATRFWTFMHGDLPEALFKSKPVGAKQNCAACHADAATGLFAPQSIDIPEETEK